MWFCVWSYRNAVYSLKEKCGDTERTEAEGCLCQPNILLPCLSTVCCDHCVWKSTGNALEHPHLRDEKECWLPELEILWRIQACKWEIPLYCARFSIKKPGFCFILISCTPHIHKLSGSDPGLSLRQHTWEAINLCTPVTISTVNSKHLGQKV